MKEPKRYPRHQSPLYALTSKRKLAEVLKIPLRDLIFLASLQDANYQNWPLKQKRRDVIAGITPPVKIRMVQQPMPLLRTLHDTLAVLLGRLEKPSFVFSATKGRSYLDNALQHSANCDCPAFKVDIRSFYPAVKRRWIRRFFEDDMKCAPDVARFLSRLCCVDGALPTGSPISPTLSYLACAPLFQWMSDFADANGLTFTLYVDDMFFSGPGATSDLSKLVLRQLSINGFEGHKVAHYAPGQVRVITGVAISPDGASIPFNRQKRIRLYERAFLASVDPEAIDVLGKALLGQYREGERLQRGSRARAKPIQERIDSFNSMRHRELTAVATTKHKKRRSLPRAAMKDQLQKLRERHASARLGAEELPEDSQGA